MTTQKKPRLVDLDMAKGIAIFLVVLGHVVAGANPEGNEWYATLKRLVYKFHMPLFMFLSGSVFYYTYRPFAGLSEYATYVRTRAARLLPGFALFSLLIWAAKELGRHVFHVDNLQSGGLGSLLDILTHPGASVARSLWYIYVLFQFYLFFPLALKLLRGSLPALLAISAGLHALTHVIDMTTAGALDQFCEYTLYFAAGMAFITHYESISQVLRQNVLLWVCLFASSFLAIQVWPDHLSKTIIGLCSIPAVCALVTCLRSDRDRRALSVLSEYTFAIYLMNTLLIGLTKGVLLKFMDWDHGNFLLFFPLLLAAGVVGPILAHRYVLARIPYLSRITK